MLRPRLIFVEETVSTNDDIKKAVRESPGGLYLCEYCSRQTGGRGRTGKSFLSPDGGIYFSFSVPLVGNEENVSFLTLVAGLAVCEKLRGVTGLDVGMKWPNDLYVGGKKLCGILTELITAGGRKTAVVGVGINNRRVVFPPELRDKVTCLQDEGIIITDAGGFIDDTVSDIYYLVYGESALSGKHPQIAALLRKRSVSVGKTAFYNGKTGTVTDINEDGSVKVDFGGTAENIISGELIQDMNGNGKEG